MKKPTKALLLAGGSGKRFWPLGWSKPLTEYCGKNLIEYILRGVTQSGIHEAVIVTNSSDENRIKQIRIPDLTITTCIQEKPHGMADAMITARDFITGTSCLVMNADDVVDQSLFSEIKQKINNQENFIVGKKLDEYIDVGYLVLKDGMVRGITEKPGKGNEPSKLAYLVFDFFPDTDAFLKILDQTTSERDDTFEKALTKYLESHASALHEYKGFWQPLKYPWHMLSLMKYFLSALSENHGKPSVRKANSIIEGPVYFEDGVRIMENTKIVGPCYIGKNVVIGNNSMVRESHIGEGSVIGFNSDVTRSYIGRDCWLHSNYVGDSILSDNVSMGSGSVLANFRLDEGIIRSLIAGVKIETGMAKLGACIGPNVRIGVQASVMPGVKIGRDSFVGAGLLVSVDIPDASFAMLKQDIFTLTSNTASLAGKNRNNYKKLL